MKQETKSTAIKVIFVLALCLAMYTLQGCDVKKKAQRHLDKAVRLDPSILQKDTIKLNDTIEIKSVQHDTILDLEKIHDTVTIQKDKLRMRVLRVRDSIFLQGECLGDTVYLEREIAVERIIKQEFPEPIKKLLKWWWVFALVLTLVLFLRLLKK